MLKLFALVALTLSLAIPITSHAQDAGATQLPSVTVNVSQQAAPDINALASAVQLHDWQLVAAAGLGVLAWAIRRFLKPTHFFQGVAGGVILTGLSAMVGALLPVLHAHAFSYPSLVGALAAGISAALAISNPTNAGSTTAKLVLVLGLGLGAFGCGEVGLQQGVANAATIVKASGTVLTEYDQQQDEQAVELAQTGNIDGSAKLRNEWRPKLKKARAVFRGANAGLLSIEIGLNAWRASKAKALDWAALGVEVAKIVADVVKVMQDLGVKLPAIPGLTIRGPAPPPSLLLAAVLR